MFADDRLMREQRYFASRDRSATLIRSDPKTRLAVAATDTIATNSLRDMSLWSMAYLEEQNAVGVLVELSIFDPVPRIRKSASWALMKLGAMQGLLDSLRSESDSNIGAWKQHLVFELQDRASPFDDRSVRVLNNQPYDFTMPLEVEGVVEFHDSKGDWHTYIAGPMSNERLIGDLTPAINANTFQNTIVLQKRIKNLNGSGKDHVDGYYLKGVSRQMSDRVFRHQYEAISHHDVYPSGIVGDESQGVIKDASAVVERMADTHLTTGGGAPFPYPHSVRGSFKGFVYMNPSVIDDPTTGIDGRLQIVSPVDAQAGSLVNGVFQGTFRGVPEDIDGDGTVELNGVPMLVRDDGTVLDRSPASTMP
jgi:hypothetical protein